VFIEDRGPVDHADDGEGLVELVNRLWLIGLLLYLIPDAAQVAFGIRTFLVYPFADLGIGMGCAAPRPSPQRF
jgi:hypothetical protein